MGCPEAGHCAAYGAEFLFIHDLTGKAEGGELIALLILYVGTQLASGAVMAVTADKSQRMMMFLLPLVFVPFILKFPAGLILYWITTNFWTIGQQLAIKRIIPPPVVATPEGAAAIAAAKPPPPPPRKKKRRR
jgi:YidC/Oxa1 family membrane protein insertase